MAPEISVVIPMRNEALNVDAVYGELTTALTAFGRPYELVIVDDGSTDDTFDRRRQLPSLSVTRSPKKIAHTGMVFSYRAKAETLAMIDRRKMVERYVELMALDYFAEKEPHVRGQARQRLEDLSRAAVRGSPDDT